MNRLQVRLVNIKKIPLSVFDSVEGILSFRIDRKTPLGNPFDLKRYSRDEAIELYRKYFYSVILSDSKALKILNEMAFHLSIGGTVVLGCHCYPKQCHGEVVKNYIIDHSKFIEKTNVWGF